MGLAHAASVRLGSGSGSASARLGSASDRFGFGSVWLRTGWPSDPDRLRLGLARLRLGSASVRFGFGPAWLRIQLGFGSVRFGFGPARPGLGSERVRYGSEKPLQKNLQTHDLVRIYRGTLKSKTRGGSQGARPKMAQKSGRYALISGRYG